MPTMPITAGKYGGAGTGNLNAAKTPPSIAPVNVHKNISLTIKKYPF
jgi:hypothetical protein